MSNLTQTQQDAKQAYLNRQSEQMLALYEKADTDERKAIIKQIDSFLSVVSQEGKVFWLKFRRKLEMLNESKVLFSLGKVYLTIGARGSFGRIKSNGDRILLRHQVGDYGDVCEDDKRENELSVIEGFRILSSYRTNLGTKIWIITEADRTATTALLPCEY